MRISTALFIVAILVYLCLSVSICGSVFSGSRHQAGLQFRNLDLNARAVSGLAVDAHLDRKSTRLNSSHLVISYAVFCLNKTLDFNTAMVNGRRPRGRAPVRVPSLPC